MIKINNILRKISKERERKGRDRMIVGNSRIG